MQARTFIAYKPFGMLTQFSGQTGDLTLKDLDFDFAKDVYPVGRLDKDSEGLLLLSSDTRINQALLTPRFGHQKEYWVQVDQIPDAQDLERLQAGLRIKGGHLTAPCQASLIPEPELAERDPPVRFRKNIPTAWLQIILHEGKNRQVRRMTAGIGHPTLRLLRWRIEHLTLAGLAPGQARALSSAEWHELKQRLQLR